MLSAYRIMWMFVMFDLPVVTKSDRTLATRFRLNLMDLGFEMVQFSVYARHCSSAEKIASLQSRIIAKAPEEGGIKIFSITDKQFSNIVHVGGPTSKKQDLGQLVLF